MRGEKTIIVAGHTDNTSMKARDTENFIQQFLRLLPADLSRSREDFEKVVRASLNATFSRMNLVTREEFDVQAQLLSNSRAAAGRTGAENRRAGKNAFGKTGVRLK